MRKISSLQVGGLLAILLFTSFLGIGIFSITRYAHVDLMISIMFSAVFGIGFLFLFLKLSSYKEDLPIDKKIVNLFGNVGGGLINMIIIVVLTIKCITLMYNLINFITSQFLAETSPLIIGLIFSLMIIYINFKGIDIITRVSLILAFINILLYVLAVIGFIPNVEFSNFLPILEFGIKRPLIGSLYPVVFNISPIFFLLMIPKKNIVDSYNYKKCVIAFFALVVIFMILLLFVTLGSLGINLMSIYQFPEYMVLKKLNLFNFLDRIDNVVMIQWLFGLFISLGYYVYYIKSVLSVNRNSNFLLCFITFLIFGLSVTMFSNNTSFNHFIYYIDIYVEGVAAAMFVIIGFIVLFKKASN